MEYFKYLQKYFNENEKRNLYCSFIWKLFNFGFSKLLKFKDNGQHATIIAKGYFNKAKLTPEFTKIIVILCTLDSK